MRKFSLFLIISLLFINLANPKRATDIDKSKIEVVDTVKWTSVEPLKDHSSFYRIYYIGHDKSDKHIDASAGYIEFIEDRDRAGEIDMLTYTENGKQFFYGFQLFIEELPSSRSAVLSSQG